jgi:hypothetical protein
LKPSLIQNFLRKTFDKEGFGQLLQQISTTSKLDVNSIVEKINGLSGPSLAGTTVITFYLCPFKAFTVFEEIIESEFNKGVANASNVARMTDTSKYTGAHKERFDDSGKGKGVAGREDRHDNTGYVGQYKGAGTYDKKH